MKHYAQLLWNEFIVTLCNPLTWTTALVIVIGLWTTLAMAQDDCEENYV